VEASALRAPGAHHRLPLGLPLLRLRSDEQLLALFRTGSDDAFGVIHDRYRQRLFAYVRQMLAAAPRQDAEDVLQDVFVRAYGALRADRREVNLRAWLYRVAHNRCIDHLRRPVPPAAEIFELSRKPLHDPIEEAQRREDLARLVEDVGRLPEQQRSALLMREIDGMSYGDLAGALDVTVPAVKSLLVRARIGLVEAAAARDADCADIRGDLMASYDRGVKASARARRHMRTCDGCREYRTALRGMRRSFAALSPVAAGPLALGAKLLGLAGGGGGAAAGGSAAAGGGAAAVGGGSAALGGVATVSACKVAAVVCATALTAGGAVEVRNLAREHRDPPARAATRDGAAARATSPGAPATAAAAAAPAWRPREVQTAPAATAAPSARERARRRAARRESEIPITQPPMTVPEEHQTDAETPAATEETSGGARAPDATADEPATDTTTAPDTEATTDPTGAAAGTDSGAAEPPAANGADARTGTTSSTGTAPQPALPADAVPPSEH
jgi:RNA polymerase sigma factor (sigma-70 family)